MAALGWVEGRDVVMETRLAEDRLERLLDLANDLVRAQPDVIVAPINATIEAAKRATSTIPIVMVSALDPVRRGYIKSLAKPGGNVTGLTWDVDLRTSAKYVDLLRELLPRLSTVGGLMEPGHGIEAYAVAFEEAAERAGLRHPRFIVHQRGDLPGVFAEMERQRVEAVRIYGSALTAAYIGEIADLARSRRLPTFYTLRGLPDAGGLMSYGANLSDLYKRAAGYVDKILRGAKPADLPVEQPTTFELVINAKTAKALGLTIPPSLRARADEVIE